MGSVLLRKFAFVDPATDRGSMDARQRDDISHPQDRISSVGTVAAEAAIRVALDTFDGLDVLVNNTGHGDVHSVEDTALDDFRGQINANLSKDDDRYQRRDSTHAPVAHRSRNQLSSVVGRRGAPGRAPSSAALFAWRVFRNP
jgi:NAD(P)-dependent dehydrogenase (short-subunit alcohol dehydrogenase family)